MSRIFHISPPGSMASSARFPLVLAGTAAVGVLLAWIPVQDSQTSAAVPVGTATVPADGYAVRNQTVIDRCSRCHVVDDEGRMSRISYLRKTPEGWQTSIRRMVALHGARLNQADAREIVRYLADEQGLAPEELRPGHFEVEARTIGYPYDYPGDSDVEFTCIQCHSMGRVITQRRTEEEWGLLLATHRALYPLVDFQAFRRAGPPPEEGDPRHPMDRAIDHLSDVFPLETAEWAAWKATKRSPRLAGAWALSGYETGKGPIYGTVTIAPVAGDPDAFTTTTTMIYAETGERVEREGEALVYTGYQWRGRSNQGSDSELREVMFVERDQQEMFGRWFTGAYEEMGPDVTLRRVSGAPVLSGVHPKALRAGETTTVTLYGSNLPTSGSGTDVLDFGAGVEVVSVESRSADAYRLRLAVDDDALTGRRDLFGFGVLEPEVVVVHDGVDRIAVTPETGMARVGGAAFPKEFETFDAIAYDNGADGEPDTEDDLELGRVDVSWHVEEYAAIFGDDDIDYVGTMRPDGVFVPALDGPNPDRPGNRNNIGDVWVVATYENGGEPLTARGHLVVTVPLYIKFDPWRPIDDGRRPVGDTPEAPR
ncbi:MAG: quinohemoprotein amine dehydrogenase subunit alpha [Longimicrobiales bacterium]|nr:quinohemoprotein amine dehydrogenase subunit alpha [Longimicrobiales bacterium]